MDVPSWHPANAEASRSLQTNEKPQRTEFKVMPGSTADLSTAAGRELLSEVVDGGSAAVEGRGFFDSSDRLYLQEQLRFEQERHEQTRAQDQAELLKFRSTALKVQAQKAVALVLPDAAIATATKKETTAPLVVIKTKKRSAAAAKSEPPPQPPAKQPRKASEPAPPAATSLLLGYSSDSDSDSDHDSDT